MDYLVLQLWPEPEAVRPWCSYYAFNGEYFAKICGKQIDIVTICLMIIMQRVKLKESSSNAYTACTHGDAPLHTYTKLFIANDV